MATKLEIMRLFDITEKWHTPPDEILPAREAYERRAEAEMMMLVKWQDILPSGFNKFVFNNAESIRLLDAPRSQIRSIDPGDVVLFWASIPSVDED